MSDELLKIMGAGEPVDAKHPINTPNIWQVIPEKPRGLHVGPLQSMMEPTTRIGIDNEALKRRLHRAPITGNPEYAIRN